MSAPQISDVAKRHFLEGMQIHNQCFQRQGLSCNVKAGEKIDDVKGCEVAYIGPDYTWHTHYCGPVPSEVDVQSTAKLGKRYLCIGLSTKGKTVCYDMQNKGKIASVF